MGGRRGLVWGTKVAVWVTGDRVPGLGCAEDVVLLSVGAVDSKIEVGREESIQYHLHLLV